MLYKLKTKIGNYKELRNFEVFFVDFQELYFNKQAQTIYEEVAKAVRIDNMSTLSKTLNENVYFAYRDDKFHLKNREDGLTEIFPLNTKDWKIVQAKTSYNGDMISPLSNHYAQITMQFKTEKDEVKYIVFERNLSQNISFHSWKIFIPNYIYFI